MNKIKQGVTAEKRLLSIEDLRVQYNLGKGTAYLLQSILPCVRVGRRFLFLRADLEAFFERAAAEGQDIRALALAAAKSKNPAGVGGKR